MMSTALRNYAPQILVMAFFAALIAATWYGIVATNGKDVSHPCDRFTGQQFDLCIEAYDDRRP